MNGCRTPLWFAADPPRFNHCKTALVAVAALVLLGTPALAHRRSHGHGGDGDSDRQDGVCSRTADLALAACGNDVADNYKLATANCINLTSRHERSDCKDEARATRDEETQECSDQYASRLDVCDLVGAGSYDPDFAPEDFAANPGGNKYAPLAPGYEWTYEGEGETNTVRVLSDNGEFFTKDVDGVTCVVVSDVVTDAETGDTIEDTDDWYAKHEETGDIWYCGELARDFETFEGDMPAIPELVSIDGSFKAGRDGDKAGVLIEQSPTVGDAYRQEFSLGNAEDVAVILSTSYFFEGPSDDPDDLNYLVPGDLANALCSNAEPRLVTKKVSPLEPEVFERKYYSPGIGVFAAVDLSTDAVTQLVSCNVDSKCPTP